MVTTSSVFLPWDSLFEQGFPCRLWAGRPIGSYERLVTKNAWKSFFDLHAFFISLLFIGQFIQFFQCFRSLDSRVHEEKVWLQEVDMILLYGFEVCPCGIVSH